MLFCTCIQLNNWSVSKSSTELDPECNRKWHDYGSRKVQPFNWFFRVIPLCKQTFQRYKFYVSTEEIQEMTMTDQTKTVQVFNFFIPPQYTWDIWYSVLCSSSVEFLLLGPCITWGPPPTITSDQSSNLHSHNHQVKYTAGMWILKMLLTLLTNQYRNQTFSA